MADRYWVTCQDGGRHGPFATRDEAARWAWWGHCCLARHEITEETDE